MKVLLILTLALVFSSCASKNNNNSQSVSSEQTNATAENTTSVPTPEFGGLCTWNLCMLNKKVPSKGEYKLFHDGKTYFFDTEEHMNDFKKDIKRNLRRAQVRWQNLERRMNKSIKAQ